MRDFSQRPTVARSVALSLCQSAGVPLRFRYGVRRHRRAGRRRLSGAAGRMPGMATGRASRCPGEAMLLLLQGTPRDTEQGIA